MGRKRLVVTFFLGLGLTLALLGLLSNFSPPTYARPSCDIGGSTVAPDHTDYDNGASNVYSLTVDNASSDEWLDAARITFPAGWVVTTAVTDAHDSCDNLVSFNTGGIGTSEITFDDDDEDGWGEIASGCSWKAVVTVTAPISATGEQTVTWALSGDDFGEAPHDITGTYTLSPPEIVSLAGVTITGPTEGEAYVGHTLTATVDPVTATQPVTYIWEATNHASEIHNDGLSDWMTFNWDVEGEQVVTVTAANASNAVSSTHLITVNFPSVAPGRLALNGPTAGLIDVAQDYWAAVGPATATQPITYIWQATGGLSKTVPDGLTQAASFTWGTTGTKTITLTAMNEAGAISRTFDTEITASPRPPTDVVIEGPEVGLVGKPYAFEAEANPFTTTQPITYVWRATGQDDVTHAGYLSDTVFFTWTLPGRQVITVTAENAADAVTDTHVMTIGDPLAAVSIAGPTDGYNRTSYPFTATVSPGSTLQPITYTWLATGRPSVTHTGGLSDVADFTWGATGTQLITVTAMSLAGAVSDTHAITLDASICLTVSPTLLRFSAVEGGPDPMPRNVSVLDCGSGEVSWRVSKSASWLGLSPMQGTGSSIITASAVISGLTVDTYTDTVVVYGRTESQETEFDLPVRLRIGSGTVYLPLVLRSWPPVPVAPTLNAITDPGASPSYLVDWEPADRAETYTLQEATTSDFSDASVIYTDGDTAFSVDSEGIARYYYRVKAHNQFGDSGWSNVQSVEVRWEEEINDNAQTQANGPVLSGLTYYGVFPADDPKDYFYFDLSSAHSVELWLTNIAPDEDYDVYLRDASLGEVERSAGTGNVDEHISTGVLSPGRYYIHLYNYSASGGVQPYHLRVVYQ